MRPFKFMCLIATFLMVQGVATLEAAVDLISVEHRVWGDAGKSPANSYDETASGSLSRSVSNTDPTGAGYYAFSTASDWTVTAYRSGDAYYCNGFARNTYVFTSIYRQLSLSLAGQIGAWSFENEAQMTLTDLNTNSLVSSYRSPCYFSPQTPFPTTGDPQDYPINWDATMEVDPAHQYQLILFVGAHRGEGGTGSAFLNLAFIPETGTALLAGVAIVMTCARRQRPGSGSSGVDSTRSDSRTPVPRGSPPRPFIRHRLRLSLSQNQPNRLLTPFWQILVIPQ